MATFYSSFFSSGLLAPHPHGSSRSASPSTPRQNSSALPDSDPFALHVDTTPTALDFSAPRSANDVLPSRVRSDSQGSSRPGLRRRRSSLTVNASPVTPIKHSAVPRPARSSFIARARSGSESRSQENAVEGGLVGRMRSGSLSARVARRASRKPAPPLSAPPPTAPLPAPPSHSHADTRTPTPTTLPLPIPTIAAPPSTPRRPLARRAQTADGAALAGTPSSFLSPFGTPSEDDAGMHFALGADVPSSPVYAEPAVRERGGMQVDYPSPVDGQGFAWERAGEPMVVADD